MSVSEINVKDIELRRVLAKLALRKIEALKLYRPMPFQKAFHDSMALERVVGGSNRGGKTRAVAVEVARAVTGQDPLNRYPKTNGICYCVAEDADVIGQVLYKLLFRPGAFRMIRDLETKEWRTFDPSDNRDDERMIESRPMSPLIPQRFVKGVAWESKRQGIPRSVELTNGWKIHFYSSKAKPPQGTAIDIAWFDEEVADGEWYSEISMRLIDKGGRFIWSATPQVGTERLYSLHERAIDQCAVWFDGAWTGDDKREDKTKPHTIEEFFCTIDKNKYIDNKSREAAKEKFVNDEESYRVRILGEHAILSGRVFPEYSPKIHEIEPFDIPQEWTRYVAIDPGTQICAAMFMAVPPPEQGDFAYLYDELYIRNCSASIFGQEMARKQGKQTFQAFLIDFRGARNRDMGGGQKIIEQYSEQLKVNKVQSAETGFEFIPGNDNVRSGVEAIRFWLRVRQSGFPKLRVFWTLQHFVKEIKHYRHKKEKSRSGFIFIDEPEQKNNHAIDCLRYLVQYNPPWVAQKPPKTAIGGAIGWWRKNQKEKREKNGLGNSVMLGPGS